MTLGLSYGLYMHVHTHEYKPTYIYVPALSHSHTGRDSIQLFNAPVLKLPNMTL